MFYHFRQNNSGGSFTVDHTRGISVNVIVEGETLDEITERAKNIGLYFNGVNEGCDCECCGDRWYEPWGEGDAVPLINGQDISNGVCGGGYIHYLDGRIVPINLDK